jgi:glutathione S-transferase
MEGFTSRRGNESESAVSQSTYGQENNMKLYYTPGACSLAPHIVAREAGVAIELEKVDLGTRKTASGKDFKAINPKGYVPALELDEGGVLTEAGTLIQYLGDRNPGSALLPAPGTLDRYREIEWITFISSEIHKGYGPLWNPKSSDDVKRETKDRLGLRFDFIEKSLAGRQYLMGATFTAADAYLFTVLNWSGMTGVDLSKWPGIQAFVGRVAARPKVQEALKAEGIIK